MQSELRRKAIQRYLEGKKPKSIYIDLNRSKKWFFKWNDTRQGKKIGAGANLRRHETDQCELLRLTGNESLKPESGLSQNHSHKLVPLPSSGN